MKKSPYLHHMESNVRPNHVSKAIFHRAKGMLPFPFKILINALFSVFGTVQYQFSGFNRKLFLFAFVINYALQLQR